MRSGMQIPVQESQTIWLQRLMRYAAIPASSELLPTLSVAIIFSRGGGSYPYARTSMKPWVTLSEYQTRSTPRTNGKIPRMPTMLGSFRQCGNDIITSHGPRSGRAKVRRTALFQYSDMQWHA